MSSTEVPQRRRADAERNRQRIFTAAREVLTDPRSEMSMAEVARRAGVGMATLYRNFPGRQELLEALFAEEVDELCRSAAQLPGSAGDAFIAWLNRFAAFHASKHPIAAELLRHTDVTDPVFTSSRERALAAARPLFEAACDEREIHSGLSLDQVLDLVLAASTVPGTRTYVDPILQAVLTGLRT